MFGVDDSDEDQRLKNLFMFKLYLTDKEMEDASPVGCVVLVVIAVVGLIIWGISLI